MRITVWWKDGQETPLGGSGGTEQRSQVGLGFLKLALKLGVGRGLASPVGEHRGHRGSSAIFPGLVAPPGGIVLLCALSAAWLCFTWAEETGVAVHAALASGTLKSQHRSRCALAFLLPWKQAVFQ